MQTSSTLTCATKKQTPSKLVVAKSIVTTVGFSNTTDDNKPTIAERKWLDWRLRLWSTNRPPHLPALSTLPQNFVPYTTQLWDEYLNPNRHKHPRVLMYQKMETHYVARAEGQCGHTTGGVMGPDGVFYAN